LFSQIKISAIIVALVVHVTTSMLYLFLLFNVFGHLKEGKVNYAFSIPLQLLILFGILRIATYFVIGYITAKTAKTQPLLHGFISACLVLAINIFIPYSHFNPYLCLAAVVIGAWVYKTQS
jgi:hypothetical protein